MLPLVRGEDDPTLTTTGFGTFEGQRLPEQATASVVISMITGTLADAEVRRVTLPFYWVAEEEVAMRGSMGSGTVSWLLGWRDVTGTRERVCSTVVSSTIPRGAVSNSFPLMISVSLIRNSWPTSTRTCRAYRSTIAQGRKGGGLHLNYFTMRQLPTYSVRGRMRCAAPWSTIGTQIRDWLLPRVLELTYTAWGLKAFAEDCGDNGRPFIWDPEAPLPTPVRDRRRPSSILYGISRDDTAYILDTFPVLKRSEETRARRVPDEARGAGDSTTRWCRPATKRPTL